MLASPRGAKSSLPVLTMALFVGVACGKSSEPKENEEISQGEKREAKQNSTKSDSSASSNSSQSASSQEAPTFLQLDIGQRFDDCLHGLFDGRESPFSKCFTDDLQWGFAGSTTGNGTTPSSLLTAMMSDFRNKSHSNAKIVGLWSDDRNAIALVHHLPKAEGSDKIQRAKIPTGFSFHIAKFNSRGKAYRYRIVSKEASLHVKEEGDAPKKKTYTKNSKSADSRAITQLQLARKLLDASTPEALSTQQIEPTPKFWQIGADSKISALPVSDLSKKLKSSHQGKAEELFSREIDSWVFVEQQYSSSKEVVHLFNAIEFKEGKVHALWQMKNSAQAHEKKSKEKSQVLRPGEL